MQFLKQSTAVTIMFGPFVLYSDGVTLETDATTITDIDHATTGIFLSKAGGTAAIRHQSVTASVADAYGMMKVTLDTTDTNTLGMLDVLFAKASRYLPVHKCFMVLPAATFDALFTNAAGAANGLQICGSNAATTYASLTSTGAFTVNGVSAVSQTGDTYNIVKSGGNGDAAAIKTKTDNLPAAPASTTNITAAAGISLAASQHVIVDSGTVTTLTNAPSDSSGVTELLTRVPDATPGQTGGVLICGTNAADASINKLIVTNMMCYRNG